MKISLALVMCVLSLPAAAQSAYKCSDAKLGTVYQSTPCADGAEQKRWNKQAGPAPTATVTATQAGPNTASATGQESNLGLRLISYERQPSPEACTRATHVRDSARADTTMRGDPDFMQALERAVVQACR
ncbi:DUF4124 domain-containing protein [Xanthomonas perforans]|uniref:DUF4124 domain-containing protein n=1 Tax=Xanthomonas euvesicatoria TaxID=456327 RepID=A0AAX4FK66_XANEU|nr:MULTISPECIES: DUF4124 domain-containing protein [Xanthomonas]MCP3040460.1 DUF4124 domain-containing protein [Xanthomonas euvesicatoria pv. allii]MCP3052443.1 DUF4124 domain-containing protein [Xanthomonas euvesicatoria pv. allii]PWH25805.1 DUF4124 domain-containing protein [Xanthomonas perforans]PWH29077.1 DUF4124 domain-containing protein [Xanthomonas euvesicatoria]WOP48415.1 DUF4124 domain-containing protein [Xanthomonas euvesicatoria]